MSLKAREELCQSIKNRYRRASKREKNKILDEFTAATGYHRKHAIRVLGRQEKEKGAVVPRHRPPRIFTPEVQKALVTLWEAANRICSKRLVPYLPTFVESLERHGHLNLDLESRRRLLSMGAATVGATWP